jgi:hypothetical protein
MKSISNTVSPTLLSIAAVAIGILSAANAKADVVFDNISNFENSVPGASVTGTGSTPNTFMGGGYVLSPGTTSISGFDFFPANFTANTYTGLRVTFYVWGTVNTGTVNAGSPAFGNLLGSYTFDTLTPGFTPNSFFGIENDGITPGYTLASPLAISSTTIGLTFNYQGTTDGVNYSSVNALTSLISYGTTPTVGSQVFSGYYRNANSEVNGNFTSTLRSLGGTPVPSNQSLSVRVYTNPVPEPTTLALVGAGGLALLAIRRRRA